MAALGADRPRPSSCVGLVAAVDAWRLATGRRSLDLPPPAEPLRAQTPLLDVTIPRPTAPLSSSANSHARGHRVVAGEPPRHRCAGLRLEGRVSGPHLGAGGLVAPRPLLGMAPRPVRPAVLARFGDASALEHDDARLRGRGRGGVLWTPADGGGTPNLGAGICGALLSLTRPMPWRWLSVRLSIFGLYGAIAVLFLKHNARFGRWLRWKTRRVYLPLLALLGTLPSLSTRIS